MQEKYGIQEQPGLTELELVSCSQPFHQRKGKAPFAGSSTQQETHVLLPVDSNFIWATTLLC